MKAKENECQASLSHHEASLTNVKKCQLIQALVDLMQAIGETDYLLIKDIKMQYPRPCTKNSNRSSDETHMPAPTPPSKIKEPKLPTMSTPSDHPDTLPCDNAPSASPAVQCFTEEQQIHRYFGFRNLKNWMDLQQTGKDTNKIIKGNECPLEIGDVANIQHSHHNTIPVP
jgi:hypothetical protein